MIQYVEDDFIPTEFNVDNMGQFIAKIYSSSCPSALAKEAQDLFERLLDESKIHDRTIYGLQVQVTVNIEENIQHMAGFSGITEAEFKRRNNLTYKNTISTVYDLLYNEVEVKTKLN